MYPNYSEISSLYHHGIKGQKWGIIRKDDDQDTRLASEKNRLKYDEKIAQIEKEYESQKEMLVSDNNTEIKLGRQQLLSALSEDSRLKKESYNERKAKEKKYATIGLAVIASVLLLRKPLSKLAKHSDEDGVLIHYGVKGMKWGIINENDDAKTRLAYEKARMEYDYKNRESERFYDNQNAKDKLDYKKDVKIARIQKRIQDGKHRVDRAVSRNERISNTKKYRAIGIASIAAALSLSSVGKSFATAATSKKGIGNTYVSNKTDNRHDYTHMQTIDKSNFEYKNRSKSRSGDSMSVNLSQIANTNVANTRILNAIKYSGLENIEEIVQDIFSKDTEFIEHHGTKGQKWGIRRFQNEDGTLTEEGKLRYYGTTEKQEKRANELYEQMKSQLDSDAGFAKRSQAEKEAAYDVIKAKSVEMAESRMMEEAKKDIIKDADAYAIARAKAGQDILKSTTDLFNQTSNVVPNVKGTESHPDYNDISTDELKKRTDRLNAENAYARASGEMIYTPSKQELTRERLQTIGSIAGILATVGGVYVTLTGVKHFNGSGGKKS